MTGGLLFQQVIPVGLIVYRNQHRD